MLSRTNEPPVVFAVQNQIRFLNTFLGPFDQGSEVKWVVTLESVASGGNGAKMAD